MKRSLKAGKLHSGGFSLNGTENNGTALAPFSLTGSYAVDADGEVLIDRTGITEKIVGNLSPDGAYLTASGGSENGSSVVFWIAFRK